MFQQLHVGPLTLELPCALLHPQFHGEQDAHEELLEVGLVELGGEQLAHEVLHKELWSWLQGERTDDELLQTTVLP